MSRRQLAVAWILTAVLLSAVFVWGLRTWRALDSRSREAAVARATLAATVKAKQDEVLREMRSQGLLREMQWSMERADPAVFLNELAELARGTRLKIVAIGPLEQKATPQFVKSWQTVEVTAPFADFKQLVARIERDKGLLEDMVLEVPRGTKRPGSPDAREIQARFKMASMEVTGEAKRSLQRVLAVNWTGPGSPLPAELPSALPSPTKSSEAAGRDPFAFVAPTVAVAPKKKTMPATSPPMVAKSSPLTRPQPSNSAAAAPMDLKGIINMPDGYMAIVNKEIVRAGDVVENHRVEEITATTVVLRRLDGEARLLTLPPGTAPSGDGTER